MLYIVLHLIMLHTVDGQEVYVNPREVTSLKGKGSGEHFTPGANCLINLVDGKFVAVKETCNLVREEIEK